MDPWGIRTERIDAQIGYANDKKERKSGKSDMAKMNQKNHAKTESLAAESAVAPQKSAYYQNGEAMKEKSPAFRRYIGAMQKLYAGIPFWVLTILMTVLAVLQALDVIAMASSAPVYGVLQAIPLLFILGTVGLMWTAAFHAKKTSDSYYPVQGMLSMILITFILFVVSALSVSFVTGGFGSYLNLTMEEIGEKSLPTVLENIGLKFENALASGEAFGKIDLEAGSNKLNSAHSTITDSKLETLGIGLVFGLIVFLIILAVRAIQVLRAVAISRNSVEYGEKVGEAKITLKQVIIYLVVGLVMAVLVYLLDPMLGSMNYVSTGFNFFYESLATLSFSDQTEAVIMALNEIPEYQVILSVPLVLIAMIGLVIFAVIQIYRYVVMIRAFVKIHQSTKNGKVPMIRLTAVGIVSIVLAILMMTNGIAWCCSFFFSRVGGISLLTAIAKVILIAIVILMAGMLMLKNSGELLVCYETQCKEQGIAPKQKKEKKPWNLGKACGAMVLCVVMVAAVNWIMSTLDSVGNLTMQIYTAVGSYDLNDFGGSMMNEILYALIQLNDEVMVLSSHINQIVLRAGVIVAVIAWTISQNRFYKAGFSSEATQKARGLSLIAPKILMALFAVISGILIVGQLMVKGAWATELLTLVDTVYVMVTTLVLPMFFLRKADCGKLGKVLFAFVAGAFYAVCAVVTYAMSAKTMLETPEGTELFVLILIVTVVYQIVRWLYATTYYLETNNLIPVIFFDFMLTMMITIVAGNATNPAITEEMGVYPLPMVVSLIKTLTETLGASGGAAFKDLMVSILPSLINVAVIAIGVIAMFIYGLLLFIRHMRAEDLPSEELSDFNHVDDEKEFLTEEEMEKAKEEASKEPVAANA